MIVATEGVSCTGKSTLASELGRRLGYPVIGCYRHVTGNPDALGAPEARSAAELLAALEAHLVVEQTRNERAREAVAVYGGVVLDRSADTLLAHLSAIDALHGFGALTAGRRRVKEAVSAGAVAVPDLTLLLTARPDTLAERARERPGLPEIYYNQAFAEHFARHFEEPVAARVVRVDADLPALKVAQDALGHIADAGRA
ncbi:hypothetical protein AB0D94_08070 [Streptomyces sp. NPDC048255]|uniref:hypothetical protein n=1 Tax=Streptomyces sp. NPDC048255 TaxID=3154713 RepID=UPI00340530F6